MEREMEQKPRFKNGVDISDKRKPFCIVTTAGKAVSLNTLDGFALKGDSKGLPQDDWSAVYGEAGLVMPLYEPLTLARLGEMNTYHSTCCKAKARDIAGLGYELKPKTEVAEDDEKAVALDMQKIPVLSFFEKQNPTISTTFYQAMLDYELIGYCAIELVREDTSNPISPPDKLVHLPAHTIRVHKLGNKYMQRRGGKSRWFKAAGYLYDIHMDTGDEAEIGTLGDKAATELFWFSNYSPRSDYYGVPDVIPAIRAVFGDLSRAEYNMAFFQNFGVPAYAVFIAGNYDPGPIDDTGRSELQNAIELHFQELQKNPHSVMVLCVPNAGKEGEVQIEFKQLAVETKEASFRMYRKDNRDEIIAAHRIPLYRLGLVETGALAGSTVKESTDIYKMSVIEPRQETLESAINRYIIQDGFGVDGWRFEFADIDNTDEMHDTDLLVKLFGIGGITPNQVIKHFAKRFGLEPVDHPAMDSHYIAGQPIDDDLDLPYSADVVETLRVLKSLQDKLLKVDRTRLEKWE